MGPECFAFTGAGSVRIFSRQPAVLRQTELEDSLNQYRSVPDDSDYCPKRIDPESLAPLEPKHALSPADGGRGGMAAARAGAGLY